MNQAMRPMTWDELAAECGRLKKENERLKGELGRKPGEATIAVIALMRDNFAREGLHAPEDPLIESICEHWGYGAVMDAAARLWARKDPTGAHTTGPCRCTLQRAIEEMFPTGKEKVHADLS